MTENLFDKNCMKEIGELWTLAAQENRHQDALSYAIAGYIVNGVSRKEIDFGSLVRIYDSSHNLVNILRRGPKGDEKNDNEREQGKKHVCSFCGEGEPKVKLAAGPGVFICNACVGTLSDVFKEEGV